MTDDLHKLKIEVLKAETKIAYGKAIESLEEGKRLIFISESLVAKELAPNQLRAVRTLVKVCGSYGATVVFSPEQTFVLFDHMADPVEAGG